MELFTHQLPEGIMLTLRQPTAASPSPVIILCYGFCGIREILLPAFAKAFTQAGYGIFSFVYERPFVKLK